MHFFFFFFFFFKSRNKKGCKFHKVKVMLIDLRGLHALGRFHKTNNVCDFQFALKRGLHLRKEFAPKGLFLRVGFKMETKIPSGESDVN